MKQSFFGMVILLFLSHGASGQDRVDLHFTKEKDTVKRLESELVFPIVITLDSFSIPKDSLVLYDVIIEQDDQRSTLARAEYRLEVSKLTLAQIMKGERYFVTFKKDTIGNRDLQLLLNLKIMKNGKEVSVNQAKKNLTYSLLVQPSRAISGFNYLAYVGTNFDLVNGIEAQKLFFAVNIMTMPSAKRDFGFNFLMYGNRTVTQTDTSGRVQYPSKIVGIPGDSARQYTAEGLKTITSVTDNLGASFTPLFKCFELGDANKSTRIFCAPQLEFIYRRTKTNTIYTDNVLVDSVDLANRPIRGTIVLTQLTQATPTNTYDVYFGLLGGQITHENSSISVRFQFSFGPRFTYTSRGGLARGGGATPSSREFSWFSYVRTWITEPKSGITFGMDLSNTVFKQPYQPFFNVTLSKAIDISTLGSLFKPITTR